MSLLFFLSIAKALWILIFSENQLLILLIFSIFPFSISLISTQNFIIPFLLLVLGLACSSFSSFNYCFGYISCFGILCIYFHLYYFLISHVIFVFDHWLFENCSIPTYSSPLNFLLLLILILFYFGWRTTLLSFSHLKCIKDCFMTYNMVSSQNILYMLEKNVYSGV